MYLAIIHFIFAPPPKFDFNDYFETNIWRIINEVVAMKENSTEWNIDNNWLIEHFLIIFFARLDESGGVHAIISVSESGPGLSFL